MNKKYIDLWVFLLSSLMIVLGILFFTGFSIAFDFPLADTMLIIMMGWITIHSLFVIISIFVKHIKKDGGKA